tara:strand:+ start:65 stop:340 length:276 start_codon:yes stop_codon:yes gene_type:complete
MGRAIDMEKSIDLINSKVERLENITRGMASDLNKLMSKSSSVKNIDIHEETKGKDDGKKTNNKGSSDNSKGNNAKNRVSKDKNDANGDSSK